MAHCKVINPSLSKLEELAALAFNVRFWTIEFRGNNTVPGKMGTQNREDMALAEKALDRWIKENIRPTGKENLEDSDT